MVFFLWCSVVVFFVDLTTCVGAILLLGAAHCVYGGARCVCGGGIGFQPHQPGAAGRRMGNLEPARMGAAVAAIAAQGVAGPRAHVHPHARGRAPRARAGSSAVAGVTASAASSGSGSSSRVIE